MLKQQEVQLKQQLDILNARSRELAEKEARVEEKELLLREQALYVYFFLLD